jgi:uncharacterized protein (UPF0335 family)
MTVDDRLKRAEELEAEAAALRKDVKENPPEVKRVAFLIEDAPGEYRVGARDEPQVGDYPYSGPCAQVSGDETWVYVCTDDYEGNAMINREALPQLIEALQRLEDHLRSDRSGACKNKTRQPLTTPANKLI